MTTAGVWVALVANVLLLRAAAALVYAQQLQQEMLKSERGAVSRTCRQPVELRSKITSGELPQAADPRCGLAKKSGCQGGVCPANYGGWKLCLRRDISIPSGAQMPAYLSLVGSASTPAWIINSAQHQIEARGQDST